MQQALYEKKLTSYPRSDCDYLPENRLGDAAEILKNLAAADASLEQFIEKADLSIKSRAWKTMCRKRQRHSQCQR